MNDLSPREERPERPLEVDGTAHLFRTLGKQIKTLRELMGLTQKELAQRMHVSEDLVGSIERGVRLPQVDFLERADVVLEARGLLLASVEEVREALKKARARHPDWFRDYANAEAEAKALHYYGHQGVPGMLQTEAHARAIFTAYRPLLDEATIEKRVADRLDRQQLFARWPSPTFSFVLDENLLMREVGGREAHIVQLHRFLEIGRLRTVELQVIPFGRGVHAAMEGSFTLLHPKGRHQVAYTETYGYPRLLTGPDEVRIFSERYGIIRAGALSPDESLALIEKKLGEL
ncbi:helix-turn-helix domain-containing protein [Streptomyces antimicrobicus]|uniref:Helix-turn-helix transcriptional regulator n=1 Tax=Streptomyces antimicrobicus TaxID=2883108 RepID=A0ABS8B150_9ACTN|nr:helix-turn-helix transcriptional regulator [Streptomyces antimicrobicus]MCB5178292.1 helix-turn-helix transcriptional regulator [Streptomyces antimicrobicus]